MPISNTQKAHFGVIITNFFFGINFSAVQFLNKQHLISAFGLNLTRVIVATFLFWVLIIKSKQSWKIEKKHIPLFIFCAITGVVLNQLLFIKGLTLTYTSHASLLILITPILVSVGAVFYLKEKIKFTRWLGLFFGVTGAIILVLSKELQSNIIASNVVLGDILIIINAIAYTIYFIAVKSLLKHYSAIHVLRWVFTFGLFIMLPITYNDFIATPWSLYTFNDFVVLACITIGATFCSYLFNIYGIKILGAATTGNYIYTQPIYALSIAFIWLGETLTIYKMIAALLIIVGVYLSGKKN